MSRRSSRAATRAFMPLRLSRLGFHLLKIFLLRQNFGHGIQQPRPLTLSWPSASLAQLVEHALRKRMVAGSIPAGGS